MRRNWLILTLCVAQILRCISLEGKLRSCWCEPKPNYIPSVCAEKEGDDCLCNGRVIFGERNKGAAATKGPGDIGADGIMAT